jgi:hypothetical protein
MGTWQPQARHRGFFLHSDNGETDAAEREAPEGMVVRVRLSKPATSRHVGGASHSGRSRSAIHHTDEGRPGIRSGSVTGSRQRSHLPR